MNNQTAQLGMDWTAIATIGDVQIALPDPPEQLTLGAGPSACLLQVSDEFGDAFGGLDGAEQHLSLAIGRALDQLYGVEWGTAEGPPVDPTSGRATFVGFGEDYVAVWRRSTATALLFAVARVEREDRAQAFINGASIRS